MIFFGGGCSCCCCCCSAWKQSQTQLSVKLSVRVGWSCQLDLGWVLTKNAKNVGKYFVTEETEETPDKTTCTGYQPWTARLVEIFLNTGETEKDHKKYDFNDVTFALYNQ